MVYTLFLAALLVSGPSRGAPVARVQSARPMPTATVNAWAATVSAYFSAPHLTANYQALGGVLGELRGLDLTDQAVLTQLAPVAAAAQAVAAARLQQKLELPVPGTAALEAAAPWSVLSGPLLPLLSEEQRQPVGWIAELHTRRLTPRQQEQLTRRLHAVADELTAGTREAEGVDGADRGLRASPHAKLLPSGGAAAEKVQAKKELPAPAPARAKSSPLRSMLVDMRMVAAAVVEDTSRVLFSPGAKKHGVGSPLLATPLGVGFGGVQAPDSNRRAVAKAVAEKQPELSAVRVAGPRVLTEREQRLLLAGRAGPSTTRGRTPLVMMDNFERATRQVNDWVAAGEPLDAGKIVELNRLLLEGQSLETDAYAGKTRSGALFVGFQRNESTFFYYARPARVAAYMADFMLWYEANRETMNPVQLAAMAYQQLVRIHPFIDANGRTTRLVMDFILQSNGYPPAVFPDGEFAAVMVKTSQVVRHTAQAVLNAAGLLSSASPATPPRPYVPAGEEAAWAQADPAYAAWVYSRLARRHRAWSLQAGALRALSDDAAAAALGRLQGEQDALEARVAQIISLSARYNEEKVAWPQEFIDIVVRDYPKYADELRRQRRGATSARRRGLAAQAKSYDAVAADLKARAPQRAAIP